MECERSGGYWNSKAVLIVEWMKEDFGAIWWTRVHRVLINNKIKRRKKATEKMIGIKGRGVWRNQRLLKFEDFEVLSAQFLVLFITQKLLSSRSPSLPQPLPSLKWKCYTTREKIMVAGSIIVIDFCNFFFSLSIDYWECVLTQVVRGTHVCMRVFWRELPFLLMALSLA